MWFFCSRCLVLEQFWLHTLIAKFSMWFLFLYSMLCFKSSLSCRTSLKITVKKRKTVKWVRVLVTIRSECHCFCHARPRLFSDVILFLRTIVYYTERKQKSARDGLFLYWIRSDCINWLSSFSCDMFWIHDVGSEYDTNNTLLIHSSCRAWMASEGYRKMTAIFYVSVSGSSSDGRFVKTIMARIRLAILSKR